ncbi:MAG: hypothetical protein ABIJ86_15770 [Spirochaetota bacterium]
MKILMVNGSPKAAVSVSGTILDTIAGMLGPLAETRRIRAVIARRATETDLEADVVVVAFPLYIDSLPAPFLEWLISYHELVGARGTRAPAKVYAICNCGFYEGAQTGLALAVVRNFTCSSGLMWGGGLGIGSGGMLIGLASVPSEASIKRPVSRGLAWMAGLVAKAEVSGEVRLVQFAFPRFAYIFMAHAGWRQMARTHGLRPGDIGRRRGRSGMHHHGQTTWQDSRD